MIRIGFFSLSVILAILTCTNGCKNKDDNPSSSQSQSELIPENIFPLTAGHRFEFTGYLTSGSSENKIVESEAGFSSSWTVFPEVLLSSRFPAGTPLSHLTITTATLIVDSVSVTGLLAEPKVTPVFVYRDAATGDYYYLTNFGNFFRTYYIYESSASATARGDSLRFIRLASPKTGTIVDFEVYQETFQSYRFNQTTPAPLNLKIVGNFEKKEGVPLTVNGVDTIFTAYYLTIKNIAKLGGLDTDTSVNAKFWLAEGVGPVQMFLAGDDEAPGSFRRIKVKNF